MQKSIKVVPKSLPKPLSNEHPNLHRFLFQLGSILARFGEPSWSQIGTKSLQKSIQKTLQKMINFWFAPRSFFDRFCLQLAPQMGSQKLLFWKFLGARNRHGTPPGSNNGLILVLNRFWKDSGSILKGFWTDCWMIFQIIVGFLCIICCLLFVACGLLLVVCCFCVICYLPGVV